MSTCPRRGREMREYNASPYSYKRQPSYQGSASFYLNKSYGSTYSTGVRNLDYQETFFKERSPTKGSSIESTPLVGGRRNQDYINPTFRTSFDFLQSPHADTRSPSRSKDRYLSQPQSPFPEKSKSRENLNMSYSHPKNDISMDYGSRSTADLAIGKDSGTIVQTSPERRVLIRDPSTEIYSKKIVNEATQTYSPLYKDQKSYTQAPHRNIEDLSAEDIGLPRQQQANIPGESTPYRDAYSPQSHKSNLERSRLTTIQRESYANPETRLPQEVRALDDYVPADVANKSLIEERNKRKQLEKEQDKELVRNVINKNEKINALERKHHQSKREEKRHTLEENIRLLREKEARYQMKLRENLSNPVAMEHRDQVKAYLQKNITKNSISQELVENNHKWYKKFEVSFFLL